MPQNFHAFAGGRPAGLVPFVVYDADDRFVYNTSSGQLYYDADGSGAGGAQLVATLQGAAVLVAGDIWVI